MMRATDHAHALMRQCIKPGNSVVDATVGNGHDTLFLARCVGPQGHVYGFDVQEAALEATARRVAGLNQVTLFHAGHETLDEHLPAGVQLKAVMFNLGYLPGAAKHIVTRPDTTLAALEQALTRLAAGGLITVVLYPGHEGGKEEAAAAVSFAQGLRGAFEVERLCRPDITNPAPELLTIARTH